RFTLGPLTVAVTDPFGIVRRAWGVGELGEVVIAPRLHDVVALGDVTGSPLRVTARGPARILPSDAGEEFLTLREYEVGDDLRRVHWRSTAHTDDLMVRQEEAQRRPEITVVLDTRASVYDEPSFETAVEAIASIATAMVRIGRRVDVMTTSGLRLATASPRDLVLLMDQLAIIETEGFDRLPGVIESFGNRRPTGALVAVTGRIDPATADAFRQAASGFGVTVLVGTRHGGSPGPNVRGRSFVAIDAGSQSFPIAWNQTVLQWHLAATPRHSLSRS
ncbi:MAG: DUF58 domain-containing protein, partial [Actinobacteria bacterium]|nr:DUF58 domain-containing protein [Actinomycetota bacterium]